MALSIRESALGAGFFALVSGIQLLGLYLSYELLWPRIASHVRRIREG